jgi:hypothetical protein
LFPNRPIRLPVTTVSVKFIPSNDRFGLSDIFLEMTATTEDSELLSSHSFLRDRSLKLEATDAFGCLGGKIIHKVARKVLRLMRSRHPNLQYQ